MRLISISKKIIRTTGILSRKLLYLIVKSLQYESFTLSEINYTQLNDLEMKFPKKIIRTVVQIGYKKGQKK